MKAVKGLLACVGEGDSVKGFRESSHSQPLMHSRYLVFIHL